MSVRRTGTGSSIGSQPPDGTGVAERDSPKDRNRGAGVDFLVSLALATVAVAFQDRRPSSDLLPPLKLLDHSRDARPLQKLFLNTFEFASAFASPSVRDLQWALARYLADLITGPLDRCVLRPSVPDHSYPDSPPPPL